MAHEPARDSKDEAAVEKIVQEETVYESPQTVPGGPVTGEPAPREEVVYEETRVEGTRMEA